MDWSCVLLAGAGSWTIVLLDASLDGRASLIGGRDGSMLQVRLRENCSKVLVTIEYHYEKCQKVSRSDLYVSLYNTLGVNGKQTEEPGCRH